MDLYTLAIAKSMAGDSGGGSEDFNKLINRTISGAVRNSEATLIGSCAFYNCNMLEEVDFPNVVSIYQSAFQNCNRLNTVSFPSATMVSNNAFQNCYSVKDVNFPEVKTLGNSAFYNCSGLETGHFPKLSQIGTSAFYMCSSIKSLYLLGNSVAKLGGSNAFINSTLSKSTYTGSFGSIYVPASLVSAYKAASNWSVYSARITAYEG